MGFLLPCVGGKVDRSKVEDGASCLFFISSSASSYQWTILLGDGNCQSRRSVFLTLSFGDLWSRKRARRWGDARDLRIGRHGAEASVVGSRMPIGGRRRQELASWVCGTAEAGSGGDARRGAESKARQEGKRRGMANTGNGVFPRRRDVEDLTLEQDRGRTRLLLVASSMRALRVFQCSTANYFQLL